MDSADKAAKYYSCWKLGKMPCNDIEKAVMKSGISLLKRCKGLVKVVQMLKLSTYSLNRTIYS